MAWTWFFELVALLPFQKRPGCTNHREQCGTGVRSSAWLIGFHAMIRAVVSRRGPMTSGLLVKTAAPINLQISDVARVTTAMSRLSCSLYIVNLCSNTAISFEWHWCWLTNSFQALPLFLCISDPFLFFGLCTAPAIWRKNTPPYVFDVQMILTMLLIMELHGTKSSRPTPWHLPPWQV